MFGLSRKQLIWLSGSMATMLDAGLPVSRVLTTLAGQARGGLKAKLDGARRRVEGGASLAEALEREGGFPDLFLQLVDAGEHSGTLDRTVRELDRYYEFQQQLWRTFIGQAALPVMQYVAAIGVVAFTMHILAVIQEAPSSAGLVLLLGYGLPALLIALYVFLLPAIGATRACHELVLHVPVLGRVARAIALARFSMVMALLTEAAVPVKLALARSMEATGNGAFAARADKAVATIERSGNLTDALGATGLFPQEYLDILAVAEDSGKVTERLEWLARDHGEKTRRGLKALVAAFSMLIWLAVAIIIIIFIFRIFMQFYLGPINEAMGER